nr:hypothetical protein [Tanacetum cinerariifolium]
MEYLMKIIKKGMHSGAKMKKYEETVLTSYTLCVETEFPAIVFDDTFTSQAALSCEPRVSPINDNEIAFRISFDKSNDEDYMYDEEVHDLKSVEIEFPAIVFNDELSSEKTLSCKPTILRGDWVGFTIERYTGFRFFDFGGLTDLMAEGLSGRMLMEHRYAQGQRVFTSRAWRRLFEIQGPLVHDLILVFFSTFRFKEAVLDFDTAEALQFLLGGVRDLMLRMCHKLIAWSIAGRSQALEKVPVTELFYLQGMDVGSVNIHYLLARYLRLFSTGRKHGAMISTGRFIARLPEHFRLLSEDKTLGTDDDCPRPPSRLEEDVHGMRGALGEQREILRGDWVGFMIERYTGFRFFDFGGLTDLMAEGLSGRMLMEHKYAQGQRVFTSRAWRRLFKIQGPLVHDLILVFFSTFRFKEAVLDFDTAEALQFLLGGVRDLMLRMCHKLIAWSIAGRSQALEKVPVTELFYLKGMDVGSVNIPYLLARYLRLFSTKRKHGAMISTGQFIARLPKNFRLLSEDKTLGTDDDCPRPPCD